MARVEFWVTQNSTIHVHTKNPPQKQATLLHTLIPISFSISDDMKLNLHEKFRQPFAYILMGQSFYSVFTYLMVMTIPHENEIHQKILIKNVSFTIWDKINKILGKCKQKYYHMRHKPYKFPSTILIRPLIKTCKSSCQRRFLEYIISPCNYRVCLQNIQRGVQEGGGEQSVH